MGRRTLASAKAAGTSFETKCAEYLTEKLKMKITRMPKNGARDLGDLYGVEFQGEPMVVECKSPGRDSAWSVAGWWKETLTEMENHCTDYGVLVVKRFQKGIPHAICILDSTQWERVRGDDFFTPYSTPAVGFGKWGELIDSHGVVSTKRRGSDGLWIILPLEKMAHIIFSNHKPITTTIDSDSVNKLLTGETVTITSDDGVPITINVA